MANTIGLFLLCLPFVLMLILGSYELLGNLFRAYAKSRLGWLASVLFLPHIASKLLDRIYDACIAGELLSAASYLLPLVLILVFLDLLLRANAPE